MDYLALKMFCQRIIEENKLPLPVNIKLFGLGMNLMFEMNAVKMREGIYDWSDAHEVGSYSGPYTVRFTAAGIELIRDYPDYPG
ncbi:MAG: hypothetical protein WBR26_18765 [Candidatus Acidiferrum sp.]